MRYICLVFRRVIFGLSPKSLNGNNIIINMPTVYETERDTDSDRNRTGRESQEATDRQQYRGTTWKDIDVKYIKII